MVFCDNHVQPKGLDQGPMHSTIGLEQGQATFKPLPSGALPKISDPLTPLFLFACSAIPSALFGSSPVFPF